jgi:WD40 repeat protein
MLLFVMLMAAAPIGAQPGDCLPPTAFSPITPDNAGDLAQRDGIGRGYHSAIVWRDDHFLVRSEAGWWRLNGDLSGEACRAAPPETVPVTPETAPDAIWSQIPADEQPFSSVLGASPSRTIWMTRTSIWASERSRIEVWNVDGTLRFAIPSSEGMAAAFNADESEVALLYAEGTITRFDAASGAVLASIGGMRGYAVPMDISPDSAAVMTGDPHGVRLWTAADNALLRSLNGAYDGVYLPDGDMIALPRDQALAFFNLSDGTEAYAFPTEFRAFDTAIAISPDGRRIGLAHYTSGWAVYDVEAGLLFSGSYPPDTFEYKPTIALSNTHIAVVHNQSLSVYSLDEAAPVLERPTAAISPLAFTPDGALLYAAPDMTLTVYDFGAGAVIQAIALDRIDVFDARFSPDGRLVAGVGGGSLRVWDAASGALLFQAAGGDGTLLFSPDGTYIVTGDWQCYICGSDESAQLSAARLWSIPPA